MQIDYLCPITGKLRNQFTNAELRASHLSPVAFNHPPFVIPSQTAVLIPPSPFRQVDETPAEGPAEGLNEPCLSVSSREAAPPPVAETEPQLEIEPEVEVEPEAPAP